ncbi:MaoC family dehydratase [Vulcanisaeta distributa]|uniref:MaoC family dehydratase n=1 Tax=Vulcanisaeta distributa TaxID=164451 RepID=UPI0006D08D6A|nr:MaoC family dehydratase [Vulcanisaeta distributa]
MTTMVNAGYFGPFFEDFVVGSVVRHRPCRSVDFYDNILWSSLTLDYTPLYLDREYASHTDFGNVVINPRFLLSLVIGIATRDTSINTMAFLGIDYEKLIRPVYPSDTICVESEVVNKRESRSRPGMGGIVTWVHRAYNQRGGDLVYEVRRSNLIYKRDESPWIKFLRGGESVGAVEEKPTAGSRPIDYSAMQFTQLGHDPWLGRFFEDFRPGEVIVHRLGRTVYEFDNVLSTVLSMNTATLHFDEEYMLYHDYGRPVVQGPFIVGLASGLSSIDLTMNIAADLGITELRLRAPVFHGDTLHAVSEVLSVEGSGNARFGVVTVRTRLYKGMMRTETAEITRKIAIYRREHTPWRFIWR